MNQADSLVYHYECCAESQGWVEHNYSHHFPYYRTQRLDIGATTPHTCKQMDTVHDLCTEHSNLLH